MSHLVKIFLDVKKIKVLQAKMKNDPWNASHYERQSWKLYERITDHKDNYYKDKIHVTPTVVNAYVTFRSMEGK